MIVLVGYMEEKTHENMSLLAFSPRPTLMLFLFSSPCKVPPVLLPISINDRPHILDLRKRKHTMRCI